LTFNGLECLGQWHASIQHDAKLLAQDCYIGPLDSTCAGRCSHGLDLLIEVDSESSCPNGCYNKPIGSQLPGNSIFIDANKRARDNFAIGTSRPPSKGA
jgi:hypothetical protein